MFKGYPTACNSKDSRSDLCKNSNSHQCVRARAFLRTKKLPAAWAGLSTPIGCLCHPNTALAPWLTSPGAMSWACFWALHPRTWSDEEWMVSSTLAGHSRLPGPGWFLSGPWILPLSQLFPHYLRWSVSLMLPPVFSIQCQVHYRKLSVPRPFHLYRVSLTPLFPLAICHYDLRRLLLQNTHKEKTETYVKTQLWVRLT